MLYKFSILIQKNEKSKDSLEITQKFGNTIEAIFETDNLDQLKKVLNKKGLVVLSTTPFNEKLENFGNIITKLSFEEINNLSFYLPTKNIKDALSILDILNLNKNITYINDISKPLSKKEIDLLIEQIKKKQLKRIRTIEKEKEKEKKETEKVELLKMRKFIEETIKDGKKIVEQSKKYVSFKKIKELEDLLGELLKLKKSTNIEKLTRLLENTLHLMENIELESINKQKILEEKKILKDTLSDFDILIEVEKYQKAQKIKKVKNIKPSLQERFYQIFGKIGLYILLLIKEFNVKLKFLDNYTFGISEYIQLFYIFANIWLMGYLFYIKISHNLIFTNLESYKYIGGIFYYLIIFNIFGFIFWGLKTFIKKQQFKLLLIIFVTSIILGYIIKYIILSTFALPT